MELIMQVLLCLVLSLFAQVHSSNLTEYLSNSTTLDAYILSNDTLAELIEKVEAEPVDILPEDEALINALTNDSVQLLSSNATSFSLPEDFPRFTPLEHSGFWGRSDEEIGATSTSPSTVDGATSTTILPGDSTSVSSSTAESTSPPSTSVDGESSSDFSSTSPFPTSTSTISNDESSPSTFDVASSLPSTSPSPVNQESTIAKELFRMGQIITGPSEEVASAVIPVKECTNVEVRTLSKSDTFSVVRIQFTSPKIFYDAAVSQLCEILSGVVADIHDMTFRQGNISIVFLPDVAQYGPGDTLTVSFLILDHNNSIVQPSKYLPHLKKDSFTQDVTPIGQLSHISVGIPQPVKKNLLSNDVFVTCMIAAIIAMCIVAVLSLSALVFWHQYRKRYYGHWVVNQKNAQKYQLDAWCYDNNAFFYSNDKRPISVQSRDTLNSPGNIHGWMMPPDVMEVIEKHAAPY